MRQKPHIYHYKDLRLAVCFIIIIIIMILFAQKAVRYVNQVNSSVKHLARHTRLIVSAYGSLSIEASKYSETR